VPRNAQARRAAKLAPNGNAHRSLFSGALHHAGHDGPQTVTLAFSGTGFAWTPLAGRVGFAVSATLDYRMDFSWVRTRRTCGQARPHRVRPRLRMGAIENKVVDWRSRPRRLHGRDLRLANRRGAAVERASPSCNTDSGDQFAIGQLTPPARPQTYFAGSNGRTSLERDTTEIRVDQMDLVGPLEVPSSGQALFLRFQVTGQRWTRW